MEKPEKMKKIAKTQIFETVGWQKGDEKSRPPKDASRTLTKCAYQIFNFLAQLEEEIGEQQHFFRVEKGEILHISPPNGLWGLIF